MVHESDEDMEWVNIEIYVLGELVVIKVAFGYKVFCWSPWCLILSQQVVWLIFELAEFRLSVAAFAQMILDSN